MSQTAWPLDDTPYLAQDLRIWHIGRTTGIINATGSDFTITPINGINVQVTPGFAYLQDAVGSYGGIVFGSTETVELTGQVADTNERYDYVAVRYTKASNTVDLEYVVGTTEEPTPVRTEQIWELILAVIHVRASSESILASDITDTRLDETYCGLCVDTLTDIPTQEMQDQFTTWFEQAVEQQETYTAQMKTEFDTWFSDVQGTIGTDTAGALTLRIQALEEKVPDTTLTTITHGMDDYVHAECYHYTYGAGVGGAGEGPAGGTEMVEIPSETTCVDRSQITIKTPAIGTVESVNKINDYMYAVTFTDQTDCMGIILRRSQDSQTTEIEALQTEIETLRQAIISLGGNV